MNHAIISVGTNIEAEVNVDKARSILQSEHTMVDESEFVFTSPVGYENQADFLNGAFYLKTNLNYENLKLYLKQMEVKMGRVKTDHKFGPRCMDLDIIVFNQHLVHTDMQYEHVSVPVNEIMRRHGIELIE